MMAAMSEDVVISLDDCISSTSNSTNEGLDSMES